ncbi:hypothetical protein Dace_1330 [Desulfuromonas acetoxidans DSM 684]|uniref:Uncharacterized protein n=1 Tax=Desulfuromonas acetoxidans (strain DSM 684 / 11070) TaxID=281689 RepID=Q1JZ26_DESA6|nr:hypothetical protein Dace_1330 [Desulfuromonas acetoxidans DSM 684]
MTAINSAGQIWRVCLACQLTSKDHILSSLNGCCACHITHFNAFYRAFVADLLSGINAVSIKPHFSGPSGFAHKILLPTKLFFATYFNRPRLC